MTTKEPAQSRRRRIAPVLAFLGGTVVKLLARTYRLRLTEETRARLQALPTPAILAHWHREMLASSALMLKRVYIDRQVAIMASHSDDGELVARVARSVGARVVRGSTSRGGGSGLRALYREVRTHGSSPTLLVDGPRGPLHHVKPGAIVLAQMTGAPILPLAFHPSSAWQAGSWDRMLVPKPFARIVVTSADAMTVPRELDKQEREVRRLSLEGTLKRLSKPLGG